MLVLLSALALGAAPPASPPKGPAPAAMQAPRAAAKVANPDLDAARAAIGELKYDVAEAALAKAAAHASSRAELLEILVRTGEVKATVGKPDEATRAFEELLYLDPAHAADPGWSPKVAGRFDDARARAAKDGALQLAAGEPRVQDGKVTALHLEVHDAGMHLAQKARVTAEGHEQQVAVPDDGQVWVPIAPASEVRWSGQLVDAQGAVLAEVGSEASPLVARAPAAAPTLATSATTSSGSSSLRTAGYVAGGVGAAMLVGGGVFALKAHGERSDLSSASKDGSGRVTGLSQADAVAKYDSANTHARTATILGIGGAVLLASGAGLWIAGAPVAVAPTPQGVAVAGRFP